MTTRPTAWTWGWLVWIALFLCEEIPAAIKEGTRTFTLSKHVWRWFSFDGHRRFWVARRSIFVAFWVYLGCHFVLMAPWWPVAALGVGMAACITYSVIWEGEAVNPVVKWFGLRWLKGQAEDGRKDQGAMGKLWKALDGWRMVIGVLVVFGVGVYDAATGGHAGGFASSVLTALGWMPGSESGFTVDGILAAAGSALAVFGFFMKLWKAAQQLRAGAKVSELLSTNGYVKAAAADGSLTANPAPGVPSVPVVLKVDGKVVPSVVVQ